MSQIERIAILCSTALAVWPTLVAAQAAPTAAGSDSVIMEEIVVTAERRESSLQRTPLAITAISGEALATAAIKDVQDLAPSAPGLSYNRVSNFAQLNIRGIGLEQINLGGEPGVAFHIDGVYLARTFVGDAIFADLARVEVLRGPQGTLYGRNATGGSLNLISVEPQREFEGRVGASYGNYDRVRAEAMLNAPLTEDGSVRARFSGVLDQRDGFLLNLTNGERVDDARARSLRGQIAFDLGERGELLLAADHARDGGTGPVFQPGSIPGTAAAFGGRLDPDPRKLYADGPFDQTVKSSGVSARLKYEFDSVNFTSLTAYRDSSFVLTSDLDGTDFFLINETLKESGEQFSQEFQLASTGESAFQWLLGAYYFHEDGALDYAFPVPLFGTTIRFIANQKTEAYALFGQASYQITDALKMTVGLRWSHDKKKGDTLRDLFAISTVQVKDSWSAVTPRFVLDYQINDDTLAYASVSRGFKAGGLNTASLQTAAYDPEYIWNYEIGLKTRGLDGRLQLNLAAFHYDYSDLQVSQFAVGQTFIENAASARGNGVEAEMILIPVDNLKLTASAAWLDAKFKNYRSADSFRPALGVIDLSGNQLPRAPKFTASVAADYEAPLPGGSTLLLRGEFNHRDSVYFTPFNTDFAKGGRLDQVNARIGWRSADEKWQLGVFGRNLTNDLTEQTITVSGINGGTLVLYGPPRTYGVDVRFSF
jgi:iron complex outermembrane recepter protein